MSRHGFVPGLPEFFVAVRVYDGDSVQVQDWDEIGPFARMLWNVRLDGVDAPEISRRLWRRRFITKVEPGGLEVRDFLKGLLGRNRFRIVMHGGFAPKMIFIRVFGARFVKITFGTPPRIMPCLVLFVDQLPMNRVGGALVAWLGCALWTDLSAFASGAGMNLGVQV